MSKQEEDQGRIKASIEAAIAAANAVINQFYVRPHASGNVAKEIFRDAAKRDELLLSVRTFLFGGEKESGFIPDLEQSKDIESARKICQAYQQRASKLESIDYKILMTSVFAAHDRLLAASSILEYRNNI